MTKKNLVAAIGALGLMAVGSVAQACQTNAWSDVVGEGAGATDLQAGDRATDGISRFSGECGLAVRSPGQYVQDDSPGNESSMTARFFMFGGEANTTVMEAFADETGTTSVFSVDYDSSTGQFTINGTSSASAAGAAGTWNIIETRLMGGNVEMWVNKIAADNPADATVAAAGSVDSVRLGALGGSVTSANPIYFDDYEARRSTQIGALSVGGNVVTSCNANADASINSADALAYLQEAVNLVVNSGAADCRLDGLVNSADALDALQVAVSILPAPIY